MSPGTDRGRPVGELSAPKVIAARDTTTKNTPPIDSTTLIDLRGFGRYADMDAVRCKLHVQFELTRPGRSVWIIVGEVCPSEYHWAGFSIDHVRGIRFLGEVSLVAEWERLLRDEDPDDDLGASDPWGGSYALWATS